MRKLMLAVSATLIAGCSESTTGPAREIPLRDAASSHPSVLAPETIYAATSGNQLVSFSAGSTVASTSVTVSGIGNETVVGIDFRPSDLLHGNSQANNIGLLYALTSGSRICVVNLTTGVASRCHPLVTAAGAPVALSGTSFGVGFNPTVDRFRVHSDADQNLRINPDNGVTIVDGTLAYTPGDPNTGANPMVVGTGYTNNDADANTGTDLFAIDTNLDILVKFGPASAVGVVPATGPNSGQLLTVGSLGVNTIEAGLDISNSTQIAYASFNIHMGSPFPAGLGLFSIDLTTGAATRLGGLPTTSQPIVSIAVAP